MIRARAWLRVSTSKQDEETQLSAVQRRIGYGDRGQPWAFDAELDLYRAHAVSGGDLEHPLRQQVFNDARAGLFSVLVVWALDRWTRGGILVLLQDREVFRKAGVRLVSVQEDWADNELLLAIAAWQAEQEKVRKSERTRAAMQHRREQIERQGFFVNAKGQRVTALGRRRVEVPTPAVHAALALRREGRSWEQCAAALMERGVSVDKATLRRACKRVLEIETGSPA